MDKETRRLYRRMSQKDAEIGGLKNQIRYLQDAINRGGWDISPCKVCNENVVCLPDGLPLCEECAGKEMSEH